VFAVLVLAAAAVCADEPVAVAKLSWQAGLLGSATATKVKLTDTPPEKTRLPKGLSQPAFGTVDIGGPRKLLVALDQNGPRLWLDIDLDGDLSDERPLAVDKQGIAWSLTPTVEVKGKPLVLYFYLTPGCKHDHIHFYPRMHRRGEVVLARRLRLVGVTDPRFGGTLFLDLNGDGRLDAPDRVDLSRPFAVAGEVFLATLNGDVLEFRKAAGAPARKQSWTPMILAKPPIASKPDGSLDALQREFDKVPVGRNRTLRKIAGLLTPEAFDFLEKAALDASQTVSVRAEAAALMGHPAFRPQAPRVLRLVRSGIPQVKEKALLALHFMGVPERERTYRNVLAAGVSLDARGAATGLVLLDKPQPVLDVARAASNRQKRYYAYWALRYGKRPPPLDLLRAAARDAYEPLRGYAIQDMAKVDLREARTHALLAAATRTKAVVLVNAIIDVLARAGDPEAVRALLRMAPDIRANGLERMRMGLAPIRDPGVTAEYLKALRSSLPVVRALVARLLAELPDRKTTDALVRQAKREKDATAIAAILEAIGTHRDPKAVAILLAMARRKNPVIRSAAIHALARIGPGLPAIQKFFFRLLQSARWEDRVYALDAAGDAGDPAVTNRVLPSVGHKVWQVRHAAVVALGKLRTYEAIAPLIGQLQSEQHKRVRAALAEALFLTTGQHFYDFADTWARWWAEHGRGFKVPKEIPQKRKQRPGGTVASFYGLPLDTDRVVFVIDQSGSMSATDPRTKVTRLNTSIGETLAAVGRLNPRDRINVIFFESTVHTWKKKLVPLNAANRASLKTYLASRRPTGGTNLYDGVELALNHSDVDTIFLLSDGAPGTGKFTSTPDILRGVGRLNQTRRIAIHCISVGADSDLLKKLAAANGGKYVRR